MFFGYFDTSYAKYVQMLQVKMRFVICVFWYALFSHFDIVISQLISLESARKKQFAVDISMSYEIYCQRIKLLTISLLAWFIIPHILQTPEERKTVMAIDVSMMTF
jgi:hypothetical protein